MQVIEKPRIINDAGVIDIAKADKKRGFVTHRISLQM
jgi:hypothetical protein